MYEALLEIADRYNKNDPDNADFFTIDWVRKKCASLNKSPAEFLAEMKAHEAAIDAIDYEAFAIESAQKAKDNPELEKYFTGPVDGFSYGLMLKSGEVEDVDSQK